MERLSFGHKLKMIDEVVKNINLDKIHTVMKALNWIWITRGMDDWEGKVPDIDALQHQIQSLALECFDRHEDHPTEHRWSMLTGGFKVTTSYYDDEWTLECEFILTSWECSDTEVE